MRTKTALKKWSLVVVTMILLIAALAFSAVPAMAVDPQPPLSLVTDTLVPQHPTLGTIMDLQLSVAGTKPGWCIDSTTQIFWGFTYSTTLYDYFGRYQDGVSATLPQNILNLNWHAIAYIINHKSGTATDVQAAIWYFTNAITPASQAALDMVNAAGLPENQNFTPTAEMIRPIICFTSGNNPVPYDDLPVQPVFFEYQGSIPSFPLPELPAVALFGLGLAGIGGLIYIKKRARSSRNLTVQ